MKQTLKHAFIAGLDAIGIVVTIYLFGLLFVLVMVASGYQGGDMLTEYYRSVLQFIIN